MKKIGENLTPQFLPAAPEKPSLASRNQTSITWSYKALENITIVTLEYKIIPLMKIQMDSSCNASHCTAVGLKCGRPYKVALIACFKVGAGDEVEPEEFCSADSGFGEFYTAPQGKIAFQENHFTYD